VTDPLRFSIEIDCPQARAFDLWTSRTSTWWPIDHSVSGAAGLEVVFERHVGGRLYERTPDGDEHQWGTITRWEPPAVVAYRWYLRADPVDSTDVEIRFVVVGEETTRLEIEHRGWERLGAAEDSRRRGNQHGWEAVLPRFVEAAEGGA
jgi:uncharacterized protein YndB with AHSA1/START domain